MENPFADPPSALDSSVASIMADRELLSFKDQVEQYELTRRSIIELFNESVLNGGGVTTDVLDAIRARWLAILSTFAPEVRKVAGTGDEEELMKALLGEGQVMIVDGSKLGLGGDKKERAEHDAEAKKRVVKGAGGAMKVGGKRVNKKKKKGKKKTAAQDEDEESNMPTADLSVDPIERGQDTLAMAAIGKEAIEHLRTTSVGDGGPSGDSAGTSETGNTGTRKRIYRRWSADVLTGIATSRRELTSISSVITQLEAYPSGNSTEEDLQVSTAIASARKEAKNICSVISQLEAIVADDDSVASEAMDREKFNIGTVDDVTGRTSTASEETAVVAADVESIGSSPTVTQMTPTSSDEEGTLVDEQTKNTAGPTGSLGEATAMSGDDPVLGTGAHQAGSVQLAKGKKKKLVATGKKKSKTPTSAKKPSSPLLNTQQNTPSNMEPNSPVEQQQTKNTMADTASTTVDDKPHSVLETGHAASDTGQIPFNPHNCQGANADPELPSPNPPSPTSLEPEPTTLPNLNTTTSAMGGQFSAKDPRDLGDDTASDTDTSTDNDSNLSGPVEIPERDITQSGDKTVRFRGASPNGTRMVPPRGPSPHPNPRRRKQTTQAKDPAGLEENPTDTSVSSLLLDPHPISPSTERVVMINGTPVMAPYLNLAGPTTRPEIFRFSRFMPAVTTRATHYREAYAYHREVFEHSLGQPESELRPERESLLEMNEQAFNWAVEELRAHHQLERWRIMTAPSKEMLEEADGKWPVYWDMRMAEKGGTEVWDEEMMEGGCRGEFGACENSECCRVREAETRPMGWEKTMNPDGTTKEEEPTMTRSQEKRQRRKSSSASKKERLLKEKHEKAKLAGMTSRMEVQEGLRKKKPKAKKKKAVKEELSAAGETAVEAEASRSSTPVAAINDAATDDADAHSAVEHDESGPPSDASDKTITPTANSVERGSVDRSHSSRSSDKTVTSRCAHHIRVDSAALDSPLGEPPYDLPADSSITTTWLTPPICRPGCSPPYAPLHPPTLPRASSPTPNPWMVHIAIDFTTPPLGFGPRDHRILFGVHPNRACHPLIIIKDWPATRIGEPNPHTETIQTLLPTYTHPNTLSFHPSPFYTISTPSPAHDLLSIPLTTGGYVRAWGPNTRYGDWISVSWPSDVARPTDCIIMLCAWLLARRRMRDEAACLKWWEGALGRWCVTMWERVERGEAVPGEWCFGCGVRLLPDGKHPDGKLVVGFPENGNPYDNEFARREEERRVWREMERVREREHAFQKGQESARMEQVQREWMVMGGVGWEGGVVAPAMPPPMVAPPVQFGPYGMHQNGMPHYGPGQYAPPQYVPPQYVPPQYAPQPYGPPYHGAHQNGRQNGPRQNNGPPQNRQPQNGSRAQNGGGHQKAPQNGPSENTAGQQKTPHQKGDGLQKAASAGAPEIVVNQPKATQKAPPQNGGGQQKPPQNGAAETKAETSRSDNT